MVRRSKAFMAGGPDHPRPLAEKQGIPGNGYFHLVRESFSSRLRREQYLPAPASGR